MIDLGVLNRSAVEEIALLCLRALDRAPTAGELADSLFAPDEHVIVRGNPALGVVASIPAPAARARGTLDPVGGPAPVATAALRPTEPSAPERVGAPGGARQGYVRLLVVDPAHQGRGHGRALLRAAEADVVGVGPEPATVTIGADAPGFLFPGVETSQLAMLCLVESCRYARRGVNVNMDIDLTCLPPDAGRGEVGGASDRDEVATFLADYWPAWTREALRALDKGTLMIGRDDDGIAGFCAWNVNRGGLLGPVAVRHDLIGMGRGQPLVLSALHRMAAGGPRGAEVVWVGPLVPYARLGATVGRVFLVYERTLRPGGLLA